MFLHCYPGVLTYPALCRKTQKGFSLKGFAVNVMAILERVRATNREVYDLKKKLESIHIKTM